MKYQLMVKSMAGAALVLGSLNAAASGFGGGWKHDSTGTLTNTNAPSYESSSPAASMKSRKGSDFADGWSHDSNTGTLYNANAPSYKNGTTSSGEKQTVLNSFGGGWGHDDTGTLTYIR